MPFPYPWQGIKDPLAIPSGAMRSYVQIQRQGGRDAAGGLADVWTPVWSTMAAIATLSQSEVYEPGQIVGRVSHRVTVRWPGASMVIAEGMRVAYNGRTFQIQAVDNVQERNRVLHLLCLEINGSQQ